MRRRDTIDIDQAGIELSTADRKMGKCMWGRGYDGPGSTAGQLNAPCCLAYQAIQMATDG